MLKTITVLSIEQYHDCLFAKYYELSVHDSINLKFYHGMQFLLVFIIICWTNIILVLKSKTIIESIKDILMCLHHF